MTVDLIQRGYRLFAPFYDAVFGSSLQGSRRLAVESLHCQPGDRVLEVCVGTGMSLALFPPDVQVTGIDISGEMLAKARARVKRLGLRNVKALERMDAEHLAFPDASFDKVAMLFALSGLPDPVRAAEEMRRVCRPGGTIVIAAHFRSRRPLVRLCEGLLSPIYRLLRYRADLDLDEFLARAGLDVREVKPANLFDYSTILVCRR
ncbi:MAG: methyltransferase domain-containing protein [Burkholderiales bacterium]|nr:methyltransferase domain-containing protein [Burkholderiales bacterium]